MLKLGSVLKGLVAGEQVAVSPVLGYALATIFGGVPGLLLALGKTVKNGMIITNDTPKNETDDESTDKSEEDEAE